MKVSRKLGRRKHSHSSFISRRRLRNKKSRSCYRKKHTQQGGKYGKRGRGHKRVRTYKHGRRFHRGGAGEEWKKKEWKDKVEGDPFTRIASGLLVYQKDITGSVTSQTKSFDVTLQKTSNLIEIPGQNGYAGEKFIRFKVTMERYKKGNSESYDKRFTFNFAFGYVPYLGAGGRYGDWFLFQTTEEGDKIVQNVLYWDHERNGYYPEKETNMTATIDYVNRVCESIKLPEEFKEIGHDIPEKSNPEEYIFWGEKMGLFNAPDSERSNVHFFNSLATQMYRIVMNPKSNAPAPPPAPAPVPPVGSDADVDIEPGLELEPTIDGSSTLGDNKLPIKLQFLHNRTKMKNSLKFDYKRTDGFYGLKTDFGIFDVVLVYGRSRFDISDVYLLRRSKSNLTEYDKQIQISIKQFKDAADDNFNTPLTDIQGYKIDNTPDGTYTFPVTPTNTENFSKIQQKITDLSKPTTA